MMPQPLPMGQRLSVKNLVIRLDVQGAQDIVNGLDALLDELNEDEDVRGYMEVMQTYDDIMNQLQQQGVTQANEE